MIYLDHAATSLHKPPQVMEAVMEAMGHMGNCGRGAHGASLQAARTVYAARELLSELFHAEDPSRVAFTANSTESLNTAILGLFGPGDHIITTALEHNSVLRPLYLLKQRGLQMTVLPADEKGRIRYEGFMEAVRENTRGVVCTHASNVTGNLLDLDRIGAFCRERKLLMVVDASQTAGVFDIDMERMGIDVLCFTGHKSLMGPQGTGGICVKAGVSIRPLVVGGSGMQSFLKTHPVQMPEALEAGTLNVHGIAGLHAALRFLKETGLSRIREREYGLMSQFYRGIRDMPGVTVYGDFSGTDESQKMSEQPKAIPFRAPIVSINIGDCDSGQVADWLACDYGICTRAGVHCAPLIHEALGTESRGAVRFSMSYFNTEAEIDQAVFAVRRIAAE